jgi:hypothetical protein
MVFLYGWLCNEKGDRTSPALKAQGIRTLERSCPLFRCKPLRPLRRVSVGGIYFGIRPMAGEAFAFVGLPVVVQIIALISRPAGRLLDAAFDQRALRPGDGQQEAIESNTAAARRACHCFVAGEDLTLIPTQMPFKVPVWHEIAATGTLQFGRHHQDSRVACPLRLEISLGPL